MKLLPYPTHPPNFLPPPHPLSLPSSSHTPALIYMSAQLPPISWDHEKNIVTTRHAALLLPAMPPYHPFPAPPRPPPPRCRLGVPFVPSPSLIRNADPTQGSHTPPFPSCRSYVANGDLSFRQRREQKMRESECGERGSGEKRERERERAHQEQQRGRRGEVKKGKSTPPPPTFAPRTLFLFPTHTLCVRLAGSPRFKRGAAHPPTITWITPPPLALSASVHCCGSIRSVIPSLPLSSPPPCFPPYHTPHTTPLCAVVTCCLCCLAPKNSTFGFFRSLGHTHTHTPVRHKPSPLSPYCEARVRITPQLICSIHLRW